MGSLVFFFGGKLLTCFGFLRAPGFMTWLTCRRVLVFIMG